MTTPGEDEEAHWDQEIDNFEYQEWGKADELRIKANDHSLISLGLGPLRYLPGIGKGVDIADAIVDHVEGKDQSYDINGGGSGTPPGPKPSGSYTNTHESGRTYSGKGGKERSQDSGRRIERRNEDPHIATDWTPAPSGREGFKQESRRIDGQGGPKNSRNYNQIDSPGKKMRIEDSEILPPPKKN